MAIRPLQRSPDMTNCSWDIWQQLEAEAAEDTAAPDDLTTQFGAPGTRRYLHAVPSPRRRTMPAHDRKGLVENVSNPA